MSLLLVYRNYTKFRNINTIYYAALFKTLCIVTSILARIAQTSAYRGTPRAASIILSQIAQNPAFGGPEQVASILAQIAQTSAYGGTPRAASILARMVQTSTYGSTTRAAEILSQIAQTSAYGGIVRAADIFDQIVQNHRDGGILRAAEILDQIAQIPNGGTERAAEILIWIVQNHHSDEGMVRAADILARIAQIPAAGRVEQAAAILTCMTNTIDAAGNPIPDPEGTTRVADILARIAQRSIARAANILVQITQSPVDGGISQVVAILRQITRINNSAGRSSPHGAIQVAEILAQMETEQAATILLWMADSYLIGAVTILTHMAERVGGIEQTATILDQIAQSPGVGAERAAAILDQIAQSPGVGAERAVAIFRQIQIEVAAAILAQIAQNYHTSGVIEILTLMAHTKDRDGNPTLDGTRQVDEILEAMYQLVPCGWVEDIQNRLSHAPPSALLGETDTRAAFRAICRLTFGTLAEVVAFLAYLHTRAYDQLTVQEQAIVTMFTHAGVEIGYHLDVRIIDDTDHHASDVCAIVSDVHADGSATIYIPRAMMDILTTLHPAVLVQFVRHEQEEMGLGGEGAHEQVLRDELRAHPDDTAVADFIRIAPTLHLLSSSTLTPATYENLQEILTWYRSVAPNGNLSIAFRSMFQNIAKFERLSAVANFLRVKHARPASTDVQRVSTMHAAVVVTQGTESRFSQGMARFVERLYGMRTAVPEAQRDTFVRNFTITAKEISEHETREAQGKQHDWLVENAGKYQKALIGIMPAVNRLQELESRCKASMLAGTPEMLNRNAMHAVRMDVCTLQGFVNLLARADADDVDEAQVLAQMFPHINAACERFEGARSEVVIPINVVGTGEHALRTYLAQRGLLDGKHDIKLVGDFLRYDDATAATTLADLARVAKELRARGCECVWILGTAALEQVRSPTDVGAALCAGIGKHVVEATDVLVGGELGTSGYVGAATLGSVERAQHTLNEEVVSETLNAVLEMRVNMMHALGERAVRELRLDTPMTSLDETAARAEVLRRYVEEHSLQGAMEGYEIETVVRLLSMSGMLYGEHGLVASTDSEGYEAVRRAYPQVRQVAFNIGAGVRNTPSVVSDEPDTLIVRRMGEGGTVVCEVVKYRDGTARVIETKIFARPVIELDDVTRQHGMVLRVVSAVSIMLRLGITATGVEKFMTALYGKRSDMAAKMQQYKALAAAA